MTKKRPRGLKTTSVSPTHLVHFYWHARPLTIAQASRTPTECACLRAGAKNEVINDRGDWREEFSGVLVSCWFSFSYRYFKRQSISAPLLESKSVRNEEKQTI